MFKVTIYIIEDNFSFRKKIQEILLRNLKEKLGFIEFNIISVENIISFYDNIEQQKFSATSIFIVDIDLNMYLDGIKIGRKIREHSSESKIMYLTSLENKAIDIINGNIFPEGYILKSQDIDNIVIQITHNLEKIISQYTNDDATLIIDNGYQKYVVSYKDILYITLMPGMRNSLLLKSIDKEILFSGTLSKIKEELISPPFVLSLKSYIINFDTLLSMNKTDGTIIFKNKEELHIGKQGIRKIEDFRRGKKND